MSQVLEKVEPVSEAGFEDVDQPNEEEARTAARKIVDGHAYGKHAGEFPHSSREDFEQMVREAIVKPSERRLLTNGRVAYWSEREQLVVIIDSNAVDSGTAFRPKSGKDYLYRLR